MSRAGVLRSKQVNEVIYTTRPPVTQPPNFCKFHPTMRFTAASIVAVRHWRMEMQKTSINSVKPKLSLRRDASNPTVAPVEPLRIRPAFHGEPVAAELPEQHRRMQSGPVARKTLTPEQREIIDRVVSGAGDGDPK